MKRTLDMLWRLLAVAVLVPLAIVALALCGCRPPAPKCPACVPPPPVVRVVKPPPCALPELPEPIVGLASPDKEHGGYLVMPDKWAQLIAERAATRAWIRAANACLEAATK